MSDMFNVTAETGYAMNTTNVSTDGQSIVDFAAQLSQVLSDFDDVIVELTGNGMTGYMSDEAMRAYQTVKDSLSDYATRLSNTGNAVIESADNVSKASQQAGDSISVFQ